MTNNHYKTITADNPLYELVQAEKLIQEQPFLELQELVLASKELMVSPQLLHYVFYLSDKYNERSNGISVFMKELMRRLNNHVRVKPLYQWSKESVVDKWHDGLHYHVQLIFEGKSSKYSFHLGTVLAELKRDGYLKAYYHNQPKTSGLGNIKASLRDPVKAADLWNWLSYPCKSLTKENLSGRLYGRSEFRSRLAA